MSAVDITPVVGLPRQHGWAQVFYNSNRSFVCVFAIAGDSAGNVGRDLVDTLREKTPENAEELHQFLAQAQTDVTAKNCTLQVAASLFMPDQAWFGVYDGLVILKRGLKVGQILSPKQEVMVIKGKANQDDVFVLGTNQIQNILGEVVQKLEQGYEADTIVTSIVPGVHGQDDSSQSALAFISFLPEGETLESKLTIQDLLQDNVEPDDDDLGLEPQLEPQTGFQTKLQPEPQLNLVTPVSTRPRPDFSKILTTLRKTSKNAFSLIKPFFSGDVYVHQPKQKKIIRIIIILIVIAVIIGGPFFWWQTTVSAQRKEAQTQVDQLLRQVDTAKTKVDSDPITARQEVESVITELKTLEKTFADKQFGLKIVQNATQEVQTYYQEISGKEEFSQLPVFFDLRTVEPDFITSASDVVGTTAYFLDRGKMQLIELNLESKQQQRFDISQVGSPQNISVSQDAVFIVSNQGIFRFDRDSKPEDIRIIKTRSEEDQNKTATLIDTFGEFVYVFNPSQRNIFRYTPAEEGGGLADPTGWVRSSQNIEFDQIISLQIDGDIWLSDKTGKIMKMASGREEEFPAVGLTDPFSSPVILFTKEDDQNIYLLEADKNRLVVLTKDGQFLKEIVSGTLASGTSLFAIEETNKAYVTSGAEVFEVEL